ncbi:MAG: RtcB family protein [Planctomycetota bacterium]
MAWTGEIKKISDNIWEIPVESRHGMRVPGRIFASERLLAQALRDNAAEQVANVAHLPGIVGASMAMPDIHWGYGFPIGGVAATDPAAGGVVSPGGVGYDINCGVRLLRTHLDAEDVRPALEKLLDGLFRRVPAGLGEGGVSVPADEFEKLLRDGARWAVGRGHGAREDLEFCEEKGVFPGADPAAVGPRPRERGRVQVGSLGSGNHFIEIQEVAEVFNPAAADAYGLRKGQAVVLIHTGSRGFGHQVCEESLRDMRGGPAKYGFSIPDRQLVAVPVESPEGRRYLAAMACAANFAWANRQVLTSLICDIFLEILGTNPSDLGMALVYDQAHNFARMESHMIDGKPRMLCVHRKGATRALPPGHPEVPEDYRDVGQPVLIPGDMGRSSYVLRGGPRSLELAFGSSCHGAGRAMSRSQAVKKQSGPELRRELASRGILLRAHGMNTVSEEAPYAYKDVSEVVGVVHDLGIALRVARMKPMGVIKG